MRTNTLIIRRAGVCIGMLKSYTTSCHEMISSYTIHLLGVQCNDWPCTVSRVLTVIYFNSTTLQMNWYYFTLLPDQIIQIRLVRIVTRVGINRLFYLSETRRRSLSNKQSSTAHLLFRPRTCILVEYGEFQMGLPDKFRLIAHDATPPACNQVHLLSEHQQLR